MDLHPLEVIYDKPHTKEYIVDGKRITVLYNINYCKNINSPTLYSLRDGLYTYVVHDNFNLVVSKLCPFEDGSKHIQLIQKGNKCYIGGEFKKTGNTFYVNLFSGLFRALNEYNIKYNRMKVFNAILSTFNKHGAYDIRIVNEEIIDLNYYVDKKIWKLQDLREYPPLEVGGGGD